MNFKPKGFPVGKKPFPKKKKAPPSQAKAEQGVKDFFAKYKD